MIRTLQEFARFQPGRILSSLIAIGLAGSVAACGDMEQNGDVPAADDEQTDTAPAADDEPRVYFEQPQDGDTVTTPVQVAFGSENIEIGAVPDEVESPREGVVHYHLGFDAECLPPDTVIPEADPWIHFGDGSNEIEMELGPGEYILSVQAGDDEHRTIEGLCETISITVEDEN